MICEGRGHVSPCPKLITLADWELGELLELAEDRAAKKYSSRKDTYGKGLIKAEYIDWCGKTLEPAVLALLHGCCSEKAFEKFIKPEFPYVKMDTKDRQYGDGDVDFEVHGMTIQVKSRSTDLYGSTLVRCKAKSGKMLPLRSTAWVFGQWDKFRHVQLLGFVYKRDLKTCDTKPAPDGHTNYTVLDKDLQPMSRLMEDMRSKRELERIAC